MHEPRPLNQPVDTRQKRLRPTPPAGGCAIRKLCIQLFQRKLLSAILSPIPASLRQLLRLWQKRSIMTARYQLHRQLQTATSSPRIPQRSPPPPTPADTPSTSVHLPPTWKSQGAVLPRFAAFTTHRFRRPTKDHCRLGSLRYPPTVGFDITQRMVAEFYHDNQHPDYNHHSPCS